jgi:phage terminase large subunit-like protein
MSTALATRPRAPVREIGAYHWHQYAKDVKSGRVAACRWVKLAADRFLSDLKHQKEKSYPFEFDEDEARLAVDFYPLFLRHYQGDLAGEPVFLEPWEQFIIANIYGWKRKKDGLRRFRKVYISVGRKNGKSLLAVGIGAKGLLLDGEGGPRIVCAATKRAQARLVWDIAALTLEQNQELVREFGLNISKSINATRISIIGTAADWIPLGQDSKTEDGHNIHVGIIDEYHEHPDDKMVGVIRTGMGARSQPILFIITTAGFDIRSPAYEEEQYLKRILQSVVQDDSYFGLIYTLDEEDDWKDPNVWIKSNPNLGVGKYAEQIADLVMEAEHKPPTKLQVLTKELNVWTQSLSTWLDWKSWKRNNDRVAREEDLHGRACWAALDCSRTRDHTVVTYAFPPEEPGQRWRYIHRIWVPADDLAEKSTTDNADYPRWLAEGWIEHPGPSIDRDQVRDRIREDLAVFNIRELSYDRYGDGQPIALDLEREGLPVVMFPQSAKEFTAPTNEFERLVLDGKMDHGSHPVMDYYVLCAHLWEGPNDQRKPVKHRPADDTTRIDGVITSIMATWRALIARDDTASVYETEELLIL